MSAPRPLVLVTNDDGIGSDGLLAVVERLAAIAQVIVVAPDEEKSGASHAITFARSVRVVPSESPPGYAVSGTPVDCVKLALRKLLDRRPDLVVSGINRGSNAGVLALYSGTVAAALEAGLYGVPAIALSLAGRPPFDFAAAAAVGVEICARVLARPLRSGIVLNVNFPQRARDALSGVRVIEQNGDALDDAYDVVGDAPGGGTLYQLVGRPRREDGARGDLGLISRGFVTVTPIRPDFTHPDVSDGLVPHGFLDGILEPLPPSPSPSPAPAPAPPPPRA